MKHIFFKRLLALITILSLGAILLSSCGADRDGCPGKITRSTPPVQHSV